MFTKVLQHPSIEPISLDEGRAFLRIDVPGFSGDNFSDTLILSWIRGARQWIESEVDQSIGAQTIVCAVSSFYELLDHRLAHRQRLFGPYHEPISSPFWEQGGYGAWQNGLKLPRGPIRSVTSVHYIDSTSGTDTLLDPALYSLSLDGRLMLAGGATSWPTARWQHESVRVVYVAGLTVAGDRDVTLAERCGDHLITAMRLLLGHYYINRSASVLDARAPSELPMGVRELIGNSRSSIGV